MRLQSSSWAPAWGSPRSRDTGAWSRDSPDRAGLDPILLIIMYLHSRQALNPGHPLHQDGVLLDLLWLHQSDQVHDDVEGKVRVGHQVAAVELLIAEESDQRGKFSYPAPGPSDVREMMYSPGRVLLKYSSFSSFHLSPVHTLTMGMILIMSSTVSYIMSH